MRDPDRIPVVLDVLRVLWTAAPDLRFGQLMSIIGFGHYDEDDDLIQAARKFAGAFKPEYRAELLAQIDTILIDAAFREETMTFDSLNDLIADLNDIQTDEAAQILDQKSDEERD